MAETDVYGLTTRGWRTKPYTVILEEEQEAFRKLFGQDIDLTSESVAGVYVANIAVKLTQMWQLLGGLWSAGGIDTATGIYLDRLARFVGVTRLPATATVVYTAIWGLEDVLIDTSFIARTLTGDQFSPMTSVTIRREKLLGCQMKLVSKTVTAGQVFGFQIDSYPILYTATSSAFTPRQIQDQLITLVEAHFGATYIFENRGDDGFFMHSNAGLVSFSVTGLQGLQFVSLGAYSQFAAREVGKSIFVSVEELNIVVTKLQNVSSVINYGQGVTGRPAESDAEFRQRIKAGQRQAAGTEMAIQNAVLDVAGVGYCVVYSNRTDNPSTDGIPPHAYETIVSGGLDQAIGEAIFSTGPARIQPYGLTTVVVRDSVGKDWEIGFSRPINKYIWIRIQYIRNTEEIFPSDFTEAVYTAIEEWATTGISVGQDFIFQHLYRPVYSIAGVAYVDITCTWTTALLPAPPLTQYEARNITVAAREIPLVDRTRIILEEGVTS